MSGRIFLLDGETAPCGQPCSPEPHDVTSQQMENALNLPWYRRLHWQIFAAMIAGILAGLAGGPEIVPKVGWLGELFIKLLKMVIVPLVFASIVSGVASVGGGRNLGRLFSKTLGYYVLTSGLAALTGLLLVNAIRPGVGA